MQRPIGLKFVPAASSKIFFASRSLAWAGLHLKPTEIPQIIPFPPKQRANFTRVSLAEAALPF